MSPTALFRKYTPLDSHRQSTCVYALCKVINSKWFNCTAWQRQRCGVKCGCCGWYKTSTGHSTTNCLYLQVRQCLPAINTIPKSIRAKRHWLCGLGCLWPTWLFTYIIILPLITHQLMFRSCEELHPSVEDHAAPLACSVYAHRIPWLGQGLVSFLRLPCEEEWLLQSQVKQSLQKYLLPKKTSIQDMHFIRQILHYSIHVLISQDEQISKIDATLLNTCLRWTLLFNRHLSKMPHLAKRLKWTPALYKIHTPMTAEVEPKHAHCTCSCSSLLAPQPQLK